MQVDYISSLIRTKIRFLIRPARAPTAEHQHDRALRHASVLFLPDLKICNRDTVVGVLLGLDADIDHHCWADELLYWHLVRRAFAFGKMNRRIHMGAAVLRQAYVVRGVPIPCWRFLR